jgi:xanthine dehydrogenase accessory factor
VNDVLAELADWRGRGQAAAVGMVIGTKRSAPRPPGAKMAVSDAGAIVGSVSGGCVEGAVVEIAEGVLRGDPPQLLSFGIADEEAWDVGLPCGGEIEVWVERHAPSRFDAMAASGTRGAQVTALDGPTAGAKLDVDADGRVEGSLGDPALDAAAVELATELMWSERSERRTVGETTLFVDAVFPAPRLLIFGAVDFARALCVVARAAGWRPFVVDPRARFATRERFPEAEDVIAAWPEPAVRQLGIDRATAMAVLTHDPKLDDAALTVALASDAFYIGAMGSRRAQAKRSARLLELGIDEDAQARVCAPIGLDLGAASAEETAMSIMSEIIAVRHDRDGGRLAAATGSIHAGAS